MRKPGWHFAGGTRPPASTPVHGTTRAAGPCPHTVGGKQPGGEVSRLGVAKLGGNMIPESVEQMEAESRRPAPSAAEVVTAYRVEENPHPASVQELSLIHI